MHIDFRSSERSSLGIEVELQIVDRETRKLASAAIEILEDLRLPSGNGHPKAKHELLQCTVEMNTGVCSTVAEARADLTNTLADLRAAANARGLEMMSSGTHPFSHWREQLISPKDRYHRLVDDLQWPARQMAIFGLHVHVGVRSAEKAIAISNALLAYLPHFLGLSASSPFWLGHDSGLASSRTKVFELLPTAGLPYQMASWAEFEQFMSTLISAHAISSIREVWWDIRPHPHFGTIEVRICDCVPTMTEIAALAALSQCLVEWMDGLHDRGWSPPTPHMWTVRENKWRAARYGLDAEIIADESGRLVPLRAAVREVVRELTPTAIELGCLEELNGTLDILSTGASHQRQRAVGAAAGNLVAVVDHLIDELVTDTPGGACPAEPPD